MKFAFDVDGVIGDMPEFFAAITAALKAAGHYIYVVTDFDEYYRGFRENELARYGIVYDELVITGHKHEFFVEHEIDFAIDDDLEYYPKLKGVHAYLFARSNSANALQ